MHPVCSRHRLTFSLALRCNFAPAVQLSQHSSEGAAAGKASSVMGLVYVLCGCVTSGFAGVYLEVVLKNSKASIWLRNIQLSCIGGCNGCNWCNGCNAVCCAGTLHACSH